MAVIYWKLHSMYSSTGGRNTNNLTSHTAKSVELACLPWRCIGPYFPNCPTVIVDKLGSHK